MESDGKSQAWYVRETVENGTNTRKEEHGSRSCRHPQTCGEASLVSTAGLVCWRMGSDSLGGVLAAHRCL